MSEMSLSIGYDLIARELMVDLEDGLPPIGITLPSLTVKLYLDDGVIVVDVNGEHIDLWFHPVEPGADAELRMLACHHWRVVSTPGSV